MNERHEVMHLRAVVAQLRDDLDAERRYTLMLREAIRKAHVKLPIALEGPRHSRPPPRKP